MKKIGIIAAISIVSLLLLAQSGVLNALLLFLLVGAIPGTLYNVPPQIMLLIIIVITWLIIFRLTMTKTVITYANKKPTKHVAAHKKRMPRRRFSEI